SNAPPASAPNATRMTPSRRWRPYATRRAATRTCSCRCARRCEHAARSARSATRCVTSSASTTHSVPSRGFAELVLIVEDVPKAAKFYRDVVGLEPEHETGDEWAWFWAGMPGDTQRIALHRGTLLFEEHSPYPEGERFGHV